MRPAAPLRRFTSSGRGTRRSMPPKSWCSAAALGQSERTGEQLGSGPTSLHAPQQRGLPRDFEAGQPHRVPKTLGLNDFYFSSNEWDYPLGHIQMLGKSHGEMLKGEAPDWLFWKPLIAVSTSPASICAAAAGLPVQAAQRWRRKAPPCRGSRRMPRSSD